MQVLINYLWTHQTILLKLRCKLQGMKNSDGNVSKKYQYFSKEGFFKGGHNVAEWGAQIFFFVGHKYSRTRLLFPEYDLCKPTIFIHIFIHLYTNRFLYKFDTALYQFFETETSDVSWVSINS